MIRRLRIAWHEQRLAHHLERNAEMFKRSRRGRERMNLDEWFGCEDKANHSADRAEHHDAALRKLRGRSEG